MRAVCVGGGPAGLYFAIALKRLDPRHHILVVERNQPDDTFGWGVVFSDQTMEAISEADPESAGVINFEWREQRADRWEWRRR